MKLAEGCQSFDYLTILTDFFHHVIIDVIADQDIYAEIKRGIGEILKQILYAIRTDEVYRNCIRLCFFLLIHSHKILKSEFKYMIKTDDPG